MSPLRPRSHPRKDDAPCARHRRELDVMPVCDCISELRVAFLFNSGFGEVHMVQFSQNRERNGPIELDFRNDSCVTCFMFKMFTPSFGVFGVRCTLFENKWLISFETFFVYRFVGCLQVCRGDFILPARLSSRPPPGTTSDEGAGRRKELSRRMRESLGAHLGARRGGAVRRSVREGE